MKKKEKNTLEPRLVENFTVTKSVALKVSDIRFLQEQVDLGVNMSETVRNAIRFYEKSLKSAS